MRVRILLRLALSAYAAVAVSAEQPDIINAKVETRSAAASLERVFRAVVQGAPDAAWIAYGVPIVPGEHNLCCYDSYADPPTNVRNCGSCRLEGNGSSNVNFSRSRHVELEGPQRLGVFFRVAQKRLLKIRMFSEDCQVDAGGLPLYWLTDVRPADSVALLSSFIGAKDREEEIEKHLSRSALAAIALTNDPSADRALDSFVARTQPESLRADVTFWLGEARGRPGFALLRRVVREDPSEHVRKHAAFGLSVSKQPEAVQALINLAHDDRAPEVRGQALFWLAHKAGEKAARAITETIEEDPETEVKKRAVFALTQLPQDEGVPLLIRVARTNRNKEVRRQAIFWLGQSKDTRALAFIEEILTH
jgi:hypothetical protein